MPPTTGMRFTMPSQALGELFAKHIAGDGTGDEQQQEGDHDAEAWNRFTTEGGAMGRQAAGEVASSVVTRKCSTQIVIPIGAQTRSPAGGTS